VTRTFTPDDVSVCLQQAATIERQYDIRDRFTISLDKICTSQNEEQSFAAATAVGDCANLAGSNYWPSCVYEHLTDEAGYRQCLDLATSPHEMNVCHTVYAANVSHDGAVCDAVPMEERMECWQGVLDGLMVDTDPLLCDRIADARMKTACLFKMAILNRALPDLPAICALLPDRIKTIEGTTDAERAEYQTVCGKRLSPPVDQAE
jgi:hypothetical protein